MLAIGPHKLSSQTIVAPMAGVTDRPFRQLCRAFGAGLAVSEMVISDPRLWQSRKTQQRLDHRGENGPRSVQIVGSEPAIMADAARFNIDQGADIIDINMGCPAKKVCKKAAGSALMQDENLVRDILEAVCSAISEPVTLKIRTGWDLDNRNAPKIARIAEDAGVAALAVHGRTRACAFKGAVEYDTIALVKQAVSIPVFANGDITNPQQAARVLSHTGADAVMIGRGAQGNPWLFRAINQYLADGSEAVAPDLADYQSVMTDHLAALHAFYGEYLGVRIARKHMGWYLDNLQAKAFRKQFNQLADGAAQADALAAFFSQYEQGDIAA